MGGNEKCGQRRFAFNETETAHPSDARARTVGRSLLTQLRRSPAKRKEACFLLTFVRKVERAQTGVTIIISELNHDHKSGLKM